MESEIVEIQEQIEFIKELQTKKKRLEQAKMLVPLMGSDSYPSEEVKTGALALRGAVASLDLGREINSAIFSFSSLIEKSLVQASLSKEALQHSASTLSALKFIEESLKVAFADAETQMQNLLDAVFASRDEEVAALNAQIEDLCNQLEVERGKLKSPPPCSV